jgi:hypothetical protein
MIGGYIFFLLFLVCFIIFYIFLRHPLLEKRTFLTISKTDRLKSRMHKRAQKMRLC